MIKYTSMRFLALFILISTLSFGQNPIEQQILFADNLSQMGNHRAATKNYLKAYFEDRENEHLDLQWKIAKSFEKIGDIDNALKYVQAYSKQRKLDSRPKLDGKYYEIQLHLNQKRSQNAKAVLLQMSNQLISEDPDRFHFYSGIVAMKEDNYKDFVESIHKLSYFKKMDYKRLSSLTKLFRENIAKDHEQARMLSAALPGLGHAVNDDLKDGINSFAVNAGFILVFVVVTKQLSLADAGLSVGPWFGRYYLGGMKNAVKASRAKQIKVREKCIQQFALLCKDSNNQ